MVALFGVVVADITTDRDDALVGGRLDAAGISYYNKAVVTIGFDDASTDALRSASDFRRTYRPRLRCAEH
jgi:hypothetical protein